MSQVFDTIVVGAGGIGSGAMAALARRGKRVLGIDRFSPPHNRGSSHGETRVIRQAYFEHPDYVPLLRRTYELWHELQQRHDATLFVECGLLEVGPPDGDVVPGVLAAAADHRLPVDRMTPAEVAERWPALRIPTGLEAVFEPTAGYLHVERCVETMLADATTHGAELIADCQALSWRAGDGGIEVQTTAGKFHAGSLIVTAGAWAGQLLADLGVTLTPLQKSLFWYSSSSVPNAGQLPVFLYELNYGVPYGFPSLDGMLMKVAVHSGGKALADPLMLGDEADPNEQQVVEEFLSQCLPGVGGAPMATANCLYTMTPDSHFVVDRHPQNAYVAFAAGLSGHGFKFAPVLGEALADLVTNGSTQLPIEFLSAGRFMDNG